VVAGTSISPFVVAGLDNGGTSNNATLLDASGAFLVDDLVEVPSRVQDGPAAAVEALVEALHQVLRVTGLPAAAVRAVGLDTPGPASATGVISSKGATNFSQREWWGYDIRTALEERVGLPVVYNNDGNAAALYAHTLHFGADAADRSSVTAVIGTGLGGGLVESGRIVKGAAGMAGEVGHVHVRIDGLLEPGQPVPQCNCGFRGDAESIASLTGIRLNLLPYWLSRFPDHPLHGVDARTAAQAMRGLGESGDEMALAVFEQQAKALGALFTVVANMTDPHAYFVGGGLVEAQPHFRDWFLELVRQHTLLREEQQGVEFALVPDRDKAGARGSAMAALALALAPVTRFTSAEGPSDG
jgi:glucokinase